MGKLYPFESESVHPRVRRKRLMLGMALIGGKSLLWVYFLVSTLREGRQGTEGKMILAEAIST